MKWPHSIIAFSPSQIQVTSLFHFPYIVLCGENHYDARFYHLVFEEEIGRVKGHFGPINSLAFHPDGKRCVDV